MRRARYALGVAFAWLPACAYTALIWWLSAHTLHFQLIDHFPLRDKGVHFLEYALLGLLMAHAVRVSWPAQRLRYLASFWVTCGLGLVDELHQVYVPGRTGDAKDLMADAIGAALATVLYAAWARRRNTGRTPV